MTALDFLAKNPLTLVADTSVVINLSATGAIRTIIRALDSHLVVTDVVAAELSARPNDDIKRLIDEKLIGVVELSDGALDLFEVLVTGPAASTPDDGEASTLAYAIYVGIVALFDERKANAICENRYPTLKRASTIDLLAYVSRRVARDVQIADMVFLALRDARMHVHSHHFEWVVKLIGFERAQQCASLRRLLRTHRAA